MLLDDVLAKHPYVFDSMGSVKSFYKETQHQLDIFNDTEPQPQMEDYKEDKFSIIFGIPGTGKSYTAEVLIEEFLKKRWPCIIIDHEKDEYYTLKEKFHITVIGENEHCDQKFTYTNPKALAAKIVHNWPKESVVLSMNEIDRQKMLEFLISFFESLYEYERVAKHPIMIFVEEAQKLVPQRLPTLNTLEIKKLKEKLVDIALMGRSVGLGMCFITQRSQKIDKDVITSAQHMFLHKVLHPNDIDIYKELIPFDKKIIEHEVKNLARGSCIYVYNEVARIRHVRKKITRDVASSPGFEKILDYYSEEDENDENGAARPDETQGRLTDDGSTDE
jgi:hypothetical protein